METKIGTDVQVETIPWKGGLEAPVRDAWEGLLGVTPAPAPFLYPQWFTPAADAAAVVPWAFLVMRCRGLPLAVLPMCRRTPWSAEVPSLIAPDMRPLLVRPGAEATVATLLTTYLRRAPGLRLLHVGRFHDVDWLARVRRAVEAAGGACAVHPVCKLVTMALPENWEAFLAGLSKSTRSNIRRGEQLLLREHPDAAFVALDTPGVADAGLDELLRLYCVRWQERGDILVRDARWRTGYQGAMHWAISRGWGAVHQLRVGGRMVAGATALHRPGDATAYYHVVARDMAALSNRHCPGLLVLCAIIRWAMARGAQTLHLGQGEFPYKASVGGIAHPQYELTIAPSAGALAVVSRLDAALCGVGEALSRRRAH